MQLKNKYRMYFSSLRHVFAKIWIDEGPRTLFRGYWATILGVIPYAGTSFFTFETLKRKHYGNKKKEKNEKTPANRHFIVCKLQFRLIKYSIVCLIVEMTGEKKPQPFISFIYGSLAGGIGQTASYPLDIVRRRMQTIGMMKHLPDNYSTILSSLKIIYK